MEETRLKTTPLLEMHKALNAKLAPFGGWLMPIQYTGIIAEHNWTRASCSLFDICHMGEFIFHGDCDKTNLQRIVTFDLAGMDCGKCHYGFMLNENGGIVDDLIVYRLEREKWMLVVNAATADNDELHIRKYLSGDFELENASSQTGKLDLQGPLSRDILINLIDSKIGGLEYYRFGLFSVLGSESIVSRTGYTGELGYELYVDTKKVGELWDILLKDDRIKPAGLGARDTLRLEIGYPLYGQDIDKDITPYEAGLMYFVDLNKNFIGKDALIKQKKNGINKKLISFILDSRRSPRHNDKIYIDNKEAGIVTSGSFSPSLSAGIGMGYISNNSSSAGLKIIIKGERGEMNATICDKPFYKKGTVKL